MKKIVVDAELPSHTGSSRNFSALLKRWRHAQKMGRSFGRGNLWALHHITATARSRRAALPQKGQAHAGSPTTLGRNETARRIQLAHGNNVEQRAFFSPPRPDCSFCESERAESQAVAM
ncbi:hypothetical protein IMZ48_04190 [Candidatus Bathyarchaeota archaeon]|nr:hypothetical protein [Candidatus Bathyarchaeota archaeon]